MDGKKNTVCELCQIDVGNVLVMESHINGKKHQARLKKVNNSKDQKEKRSVYVTGM